MSKRDAQAIQNEYVQVCAELGELELKKSLVSRELNAINDAKNNRVQKLEALNKEFAQLKQNDAVEAALPEAKPEGEADVSKAS